MYRNPPMSRPPSRNPTNIINLNASPTSTSSYQFNQKLSHDNSVSSMQDIKFTDINLIRPDCIQENDQICMNNQKNSIVIASRMQYRSSAHIPQS